MPLPDNGAAGCSWVGPPYPIRDGRSAGSSVLAQMQSGDRVGFGWIGEDSWTVVAVQKGGSGGPVTLGWIDTRLVNVEKNCTDWAG